MYTYKQYKILILFIIANLTLNGQSVEGEIFEQIDAGNKQTISGAAVYWLNTTTGTLSNDDGKFILPRKNNENKLVVSFMGYQSDTIEIEQNQNKIQILLQKGKEISGVTVTSDESAFISSRPILTQSITTEGLRKAACCNLSESFESTLSVDVSYSDAISGAKQIQMLGLAGIYTQIMLENTPYIRGLSAPFGLMYIPGSWMESINISKGTSSVINGYESITGQIDVNYKKPETNKEKIFINAFVNSMMKTELNFNSRIQVKENSSTMFLFHFENQFLKSDHNADGFMDAPLNTQLNFMNRWDYAIPNKMEGRTMVSYLYETREGGQMQFDKHKDYLSENAYGLGINTHRMNIISKNGLLLPGEHESLASIVSFTFHDFDAFYGLKTLHNRQLSAYANIFYENFLDKNDRHKINAGFSYQIDGYEENFNDTNSFRLESVPGVFAQYSFILDEKFVAIAGMRADIHSIYGLFLTPRLHMKWQMLKNTSLRVSAGKGYRSPNVYIENTSLLNSSRNFVIEENIKAEEAWNAGASFTQVFKIKGKESTLILDYFYTDFINQTIINVDRNTQYVYFYNSKGSKSYAHSAQIELMLYPFKGWEIISAYRLNYVVQEIDGKLMEKALNSKHKALVSLSYATKFEKWKFTVSGQLHGKQRLPSTATNPEQYRKPSHSPNFFTLNAQITKKFKYIDIYVGAENITNYMQPHPVIAADDPFGKYFDSFIIWGPIDGIMLYGGLRFTLKYNTSTI
ncbi:MAG: Vitamin B12 transporter BtuB [Bacteroidetes bacterium ADurb.Bin234]|nr:MAG: Vitamin B12 transporter BtuB [Bacteroidetes bacterium ADurb.Bin234]